MPLPEGKEMFDLCIIGAGMIGSAAAMHASTSRSEADTSNKIILVGPQEPKDRYAQEKQERFIFGAHYDEGRMVYYTSGDEWDDLTIASRQRFAQVEKKTGINFFNPVDVLVMFNEDSSYVPLSENGYDKYGNSYVSQVEAQSVYPYLRIPDATILVRNHTMAGYVSARKYVSAMQKSAKMDGCVILNDIAIQVTQKFSLEGATHFMEITTESGEVIMAKKVLITTGAFTNLYKLLPDDIQPRIVLKSQLVAKVEISAEEAARIRTFPMIDWEIQSNSYTNWTGLHEGIPLDGCYILPPILYPDGKIYIKIGHSHEFEEVVSTKNEIRMWYTRKEHPNAQETLVKTLLRLIPDLHILSVHIDTCITSHTENGFPYIDKLSDHIGIAVGGNGHAGRTCDEIGRIAVNLTMRNLWVSDLAQQRFRMINAAHPKNTIGRQEMDDLYDICIVGAGMIGSAAAKHLSEISRNGQRICLIGPTEPKDRYTDTDRDIYGAHYDEGRIARATDPNPIWAKLAKRSIAAYKNLEHQSGISFFSEKGYVVIAKTNGDCITDTIRASNSCHAEFEVLNARESRREFPFLNIADDDTCIYERKTSGHISPRKLIRALQLVAQQNRCDIIDDVVDAVQDVTEGSSVYSELTLSSGRKLHSKKVLLATGAFTAFRRLLPKHIEPDVILKTASVIKVEINEQDAVRLRNMPSIYFGQEESQCLPHNVLKHVYILPPIRYPDGKIYIKIGNSVSDLKKTLTSAREVADWYRGQGDPDAIVLLLTTLQHVVKGFTPVSISPDTCVTTKTPTSRLYIDMLSPTLGVALGGNGWAAKSCIEIGKVAALMVASNNGQWTYDIPRENFRFIAKTASKL